MSPWVEECTTCLPAPESGRLLRKMLLQLWRAPGLHPAIRTLAAHAPAPIRKRVEEQRARVRQHELRERIVRRPRLVPERNLRDLLSHALSTLLRRHRRRVLGDYLEFGVYNGTSLTCMYRELLAFDLEHVRLFGFDSFQGFPPHAKDEDEGRWQPGRCRSPLDFTTAVLESEGVDLSRVTLVPGWFADTLNTATIQQHQIKKASVIMIDCDLYSSAKEALNFCAPLIGEEALVIFDEWNVTRLPNKTLGEKRAFHEFLEESRCFRAEPFGQYAARSQAFLVARTA